MNELVCVAAGGTLFSELGPSAGSRARWPLLAGKAIKSPPHRLCRPHVGVLAASLSSIKLIGGDDCFGPPIPRPRARRTRATTTLSALLHLIEQFSCLVHRFGPELTERHHARRGVPRRSRGFRCRAAVRDDHPHPGPGSAVLSRADDRHMNPGAVTVITRSRPKAHARRTVGSGRPLSDPAHFVSSGAAGRMVQREDVPDPSPPPNSGF